MFNECMPKALKDRNPSHIRYPCSVLGRGDHSSCIWYWNYGYNEIGGLASAGKAELHLPQSKDARVMLSSTWLRSIPRFNRQFLSQRGVLRGDWEDCRGSCWLWRSSSALSQGSWCDAKRRERRFKLVLAWIELYIYFLTCANLDS